MRHTNLRVIPVLALLALGLSTAAPLAAGDEPVLTISGRINGGEGSVALERSAIEALGVVSIETHTPWNEGLVRFEGVPLDVLMEHAKAEGEIATVVALNDYSSEVPFSDFSEHQVILAVKRNGQYMPVDDQGPFFIIYPYDSDEALQTQVYYGRSVWQVKEIVVE